LGQHPEFATQYARAKEMQMEAMAEEILALADDKSGDVTGELEMPNGVAVQRSRVQIDTRKWLMSKLAPKKYGDKISQEVTGANGAPLLPSITIRLVKPNAE
jgi:hypothetical protein